MILKKTKSALLIVRVNDLQDVHVDLSLCNELIVISWSILHSCKCMLDLILITLIYKDYVVHALSVAHFLDMSTLYKINLLQKKILIFLWAICELSQKYLFFFYAKETSLK